MLPHPDLAELGDIVDTLARFLAKIGLEANAGDLARYARRDDLADWLDGAHGAEVWAQTLGSIEAATMLLSGQEARSAARMVAYHERGTYLVARMKAAKAA